MVLLFTGDVSYQGTLPQENLKYGGRDISESSLVSIRPKVGLASGRPLLSQNP